jgi:pimeloyl-ACP methyl ester carboxylesterase
VVHAHGGPDLGAASAERSREDLDRWAVMVSEGNAWAGSSYRRGGYGTQMAAADTEQVRRLFVDAFGKPDTTLLHGQSWGGNVAAKALEIYGQKRAGRYDGALLTNGVLAGASRGTTTGSTYGSSTSTTAAITPVRPSPSTSCGGVCAPGQP